LAVKVRALLVAFFDEWFKRYGTTFVAHYPDYVMHGGLTLSVDEVGAIGVGMNRRLLIGFAEYDFALKRLNVPAGLDKTNGQVVEQLGVRWRRAELAEVIRAADQSGPEVILPKSIDHDPRRNRVVL
jgi:hypothetical protein